MGVRDLFFAIKARDETGAAFRSARGNLQQVDGMFASLSEKSARAGRGMVSVGAGITATMAPIAFAFRDSLSLFDIQERAQAKVTQAVESTGQAAGFTAPQLFDMASGLQEITRFGDEAILDGVTAQLLTFTNIAGTEFERAQTAALDMATVLNQDLQSASIMLGKALNDPVKGLSAMSRAGITFSEDQTRVIKSLAETGRVAEAQGLILDELARQYGGQAEAAAQVGLGLRDQMSNAFGDLREEVGGIIAEVLPPVIDFTRTVVDGFTALPDPIKRATVAVVGVTAVAGPLAIAVGGLAVAFSALTIPLLPIAGVIGGVALAAAALWPEVDNTTAATDALVAAMGDEISQSQILQGTLEGDIAMSAGAARQKLTEAVARHENVKAIIAERRALVMASDEYQSLSRQLEQEGPLMMHGPGPGGGMQELYDIGAIGRRMSPQAERLLAEMTSLVRVPKELSDQVERTGENIKTLEARIESAGEGVEGFGDAVDPVIPPVDRLSGALDRGAASARDISLSADGLGAGLTDTGVAAATTAAQVEHMAGVFDGFGAETAGMFKDLFTNGQSSFEGFGGFVLNWGNRLLGRLLDQVFDPIGAALQGLFDGLAGGAGGGGLFGGLAKGFGNMFSGLFGGAPEIAMDTGGVLGVGGREGIDRNIASFRVSKNEDIHVVKRGQPQAAGVTVHIHARDPNEWRASRGKITRDLSRAVSQGQRFT